jgi:uncharacterized protein (DUF1501 family)
MITRRRFLQGMGAAGVALSLDACKGGGPQKATPRPAKPILVVVNLDGGNDWLNMMPPTSGPNRTIYDNARPSLRVLASNLDGLAGDIGLNRDLYGLRDLSNPIMPRIAWLPGIGLQNANLSHFISIATWGQGSYNPNDTGWLGRFADAAFSPTDALRGIAITGDVPLMLRGAGRSFVAITRSSGYVYPASFRGPRLDPAVWDTQPIEDAFAAAVDPLQVDPTSTGLTAAASMGKAFLDAQNGFGVNGALPARTPPATLYPGDAGHPVQGVPTGLASQLKLVAQMIASGVPGEIFFTRLGGFDTHANQGVDHPRLMQALGGSLRSFYDDLWTIQTPDGNALERTLVMVYSEFGRRVTENSGGTDHGKAGLAFCMGRGVTGGIWSDYPDLTKLDADNLTYTLDFRSLYATVLERWLGRSATETDALLGAATGQAIPRLGFI